MLGKRRGFLTLVGVGLVLVAGVAAALALWKLHLPDPAVANRDQLLRWLFTRDLEHETRDVRQRLITRLEAEFSTTSVSWDQANARLKEEYREQLWKNLALLVEPWLDEKLEQYGRLPVAQRVAYVDQLLDRLSAWKGLASIRPEAQATSSGGAMWQPLLVRVRDWQGQADPQRRELIGQFLLTAQVRWLIRGMRG